MLMAISLFSDARSSSDGFPVISMIFSSWLSVEVPGKSAEPVIISAKIHPRVQTSAAVVILVHPSRISGGLYHLFFAYSLSLANRYWWADS